VSLPQPPWALQFFVAQAWPIFRLWMLSLVSWEWACSSSFAGQYTQYWDGRCFSQLKQQNFDPFLAGVLA
jgi:hypothetical protein